MFEFELTLVSALVLLRQSFLIMLIGLYITIVFWACSQGRYNMAVNDEATTRIIYHCPESFISCKRTIRTQTIQPYLR